MTNIEAAEVLAKLHLKSRDLLHRVVLKRSLEKPERMRWRDSVMFELLALEHAYFALTGCRMPIPGHGQLRAVNDHS